MHEVYLRDATGISSNGNKCSCYDQFLAEDFPLHNQNSTLCFSNTFKPKEHTSQATNNNISQILQASHTELPPRARDEMQEDMQSTVHRQLQFVIQSLHNRTLKHSQKDWEGNYTQVKLPFKCQACRILTLKTLILEQPRTREKNNNKWKANGTSQCSKMGF